MSEEKDNFCQNVKQAAEDLSCSLYLNMYYK